MNTNNEKCPHCEGSGKASYEDAATFGSALCPRCKGTGREDETPAQLEADAVPPDAGMPAAGVPQSPDRSASGEAQSGAFASERSGGNGAGGVPRVVCLCGSSKWPEVHMRVMMQETLAGRIVVPMGLYGHADFPAGAREATNDGDEATEVKQLLDRLHFAKIDLADEILVVNVGGYIGSSTRREIAHALASGKDVRYTEVGGGGAEHGRSLTIETEPVSQATLPARKGAGSP